MRRQTWKVSINGRACGGVGRTCAHLAEAVVARSVRDRDADASVANGADRDDDVLDERRLVLLRRGEARQPGALCVDEDLCLVARALGVLERARRDVGGRHARTPT